MYVSSGNKCAGAFLLLVCFGREFVDQISSMLHNSFPPNAVSSALLSRINLRFVRYAKKKSKQAFDHELSVCGAVA